MARQALYRKWRPATFDEVVGQDHVIQTLRHALVSGRIHHAYLLAGPRGTGKTTTARLLAKAVNCLAPEDERPCNKCTICQAVNQGRLLDLIEIDAASNTGVDDVRELRERVGFRPGEARYKVYVIDEVHMLSISAFNALLKTLEEPPPHVIFVLATTEPHKIPDTVLSRCQRFDFRRIPVRQIVVRLQLLAEREGIRADEDALVLIARQSTGCLRDAESLLDQLSVYSNKVVDAATVRAALGTGATERIHQVIDAVADGDVGIGLSTINQAVDEGADPRQLARQIVEYLRAMLLVRMGSAALSAQLLAESQAELAAQGERFSASRLAKLVRLFNQAAVESKSGWQPQLPLELAMVEAVLPTDELTIACSQSPVPAQAAPTPRGNLPAGSQGDGSRSTPPVSGDLSVGHAVVDRAARVQDTGAGPVASVVAEAASGHDSSPAPSRVDVALTLDSLRAQWPEFMKSLRRVNLKLEAHFRSFKLVSVENDEVVLGFTYQMNSDKVGSDENRHAVEDVLAELTGHKLRVRCVTLGKIKPPSSLQRPVSAQEIMEKDPLVRAAVEDLGARIIEPRGQTLRRFHVKGEG